MKRWRALALALLAGAAVLVGSLVTAQQDVAVAGDMLALPAAGKANGQLKRFDALAREVDCQTQSNFKGTVAGQMDVEWDLASRTLRYSVQLQGGKPNTNYLLDVAECSQQGERAARGDGGHLTTDDGGNGTLSGSWPVQTDARWLKVSLLAYCTSGDDPIPTAPCDEAGFASAALLPPGR